MNKHIEWSRGVRFEDSITDASRLWLVIRDNGINNARSDNPRTRTFASSISLRRLHLRRPVKADAPLTRRAGRTARINLLAKVVYG